MQQSTVTVCMLEQATVYMLEQKRGYYWGKRGRGTPKEQIRAIQGHQSYYSTGRIRDGGSGTPFFHFGAV